MSGRREWTAGLAKAGLVVRDDCGAGKGLIPPVVTGQLAGVMPWDISGSASVDVDDPELHRRANADWYRLAVEEGLFRAEDPRFFLAAGPAWVCVELRPDWDVMGQGAAGPLGSAPFRPEFRMLSLDGDVLLGATTGQSSIDTIVVKEPHWSEELRKFAEGVAESDSGFHGPQEKAAARRWLDDHPEPGA
ncbi:hypothetical protein [Streptomyces sp. NPDC101166]|uniref:hypothetical protein n=1 Tax=Streptomyces sp. NPDC101166 TaxID=3366120 RepID=UPI00381FB960